MAYEECIFAAKSRLAEAARLIGEEISNYPTPVAGCNVQFNKLLEERRRVREAVQTLKEPVFVPTPHALA